MTDRWPVRSDDGHRFELLVDAPSEPRAAILFACAMGVEAHYYAPFVEAMKERGFVVAMCDLRGHGSSSLRPSHRVDFGYREIVELDIPAAVAVVRQRASGVQLYLGGHSLGGQLVILHVADARPAIEGLVLVACAIPYYRNWHGRARAFIRFAARMFPIAGAVLGYVPGHRLGFGGKEARTLMRDWGHNARTARYEPVGSDVDYEAALRDLSIELVTVSVDGDDMAPPNAVDFLFEKLPRAQGVRVEARLSKPSQGAHMRWARDPGDVVRALAEWLDPRVQSPDPKR